jgi:hypothetical protein
MKTAIASLVMAVLLMLAGCVWTIEHVAQFVAAH